MGRRSGSAMAEAYTFGLVFVCTSGTVQHLGHHKEQHGVVEAVSRIVHIRLSSTHDLVVFLERFARNHFKSLCLLPRWLA